MNINFNVQKPYFPNNCDVFFSYEFAKSIVDKNGFDGWLSYLKKTYPEKELYVVSSAWFLNEDFICKAKGKYGDLVIG